MASFMLYLVAQTFKGIRQEPGEFFTRCCSLPNFNNKHTLIHLGLYLLGLRLTMALHLALSIVVTRAYTA